MLIRITLATAMAPGFFLWREVQLDVLRLAELVEAGTDKAFGVVRHDELEFWKRPAMHKTFNDLISSEDSGCIASSGYSLMSLTARSLVARSMMRLRTGLPPLH